MIALIAAASFHYAFPTSRIDYEVKLDFDGYLPIFGGMTGKVNTVLGLAVTGLKGSGDERKVSSELTSIALRMDGEKLPFTVDNVRQFFPKSSLTATKFGKVLVNGAPDIALPVRLPGLDVKRFAETTFLPIEFPEAGFQYGQEFTFEKVFGGSPVRYRVTPIKKEGRLLSVKVEIDQSFETLEDESHSLVKKPEEAMYKVSTKVEGAGEFVFDTSKGQLMESKLVSNSTSESVEIKTGKTETQKLQTTVSVNRRRKIHG